MAARNIQLEVAIEVTERQFGRITPQSIELVKLEKARLQVVVVVWHRIGWLTMLSVAVDHQTRMVGVLAAATRKDLVVVPMGYLGGSLVGLLRLDY